MLLRSSAGRIPNLSSSHYSVENHKQVSKHCKVAEAMLALQSSVQVIRARNRSHLSTVAQVTLDLLVHVEDGTTSTNGEAVRAHCGTVLDGNVKCLD